MKIRKFKHISAKLVFLVTVLSVMILSLNSLSAFSDDKEYEVRGAEFHVSFTENGDAIICEKWEVEFLRGQFSRFYKDIYNADNKLEYIQDIEVLDVKINDNEAAQQFSADRKDGRYFFEVSSDRYTVNWFQHAKDETVKYEITYKIENAVKINENNRAVFAFRLIGQNFPQTVGSVKTVVELPGNDENTSVIFSHGTTMYENKAAYCETTNVSGIYKLNVNISPEFFDRLISLESVEVPNNVSADDINRIDKSSSRSDSAELAGLLCPASFFVVFILAVIFILPDSAKLSPPSTVQNSVNMVK